MFVLAHWFVRLQRNFRGKNCLSVTSIYRYSINVILFVIQLFMFCEYMYIIAIPKLDIPKNLWRIYKSYQTSPNSYYLSWLKYSGKLEVSLWRDIFKRYITSFQCYFLNKAAQMHGYSLKRTLLRSLKNDFTEIFILNSFSTWLYGILFCYFNQTCPVLFYTN